MILVEMVHDARIIRMNGQHFPPTVRQVDGRFGRPLGRRHAGRRDHEFHEQDAVSRRQREPDGHRTLHRDRSQTRSCIGSPSTIRRRGIARGPASIPGRPLTNRSTNTPATKAITRSRTCCAARDGLRNHRASRRHPYVVVGFSRPDTVHLRANTTDFRT